MNGPQQELQKNALGPWQIVFFVIAAAAPLTGMMGSVPPAISLGNGAGLPGIYVLAGAILLLFSVGYAAMSRHVVNAGAFYAYIAQGLGRPIGVGAAFVAILSYNAVQVGLYGLFGFFCTVVLNPAIHLDIPWFIYSSVALVLVQILGLRRVDLNSKVLGLLMCLEMGILAVLSVAIVLQGGGPHGLTLQPFAVSRVLGGNPGIALMFALGSFIGFEATAIYGEESRDPKRTVPLATYASVLLISVFFAFVTWTIVCSYGLDAVTDAATRDPGNFWFNPSTERLGSFATLLMSLLLLSSIFASLLAFHNAITRYFYALGRVGLLPKGFTHTHPRFLSPYRASYAQTGISAVGILVFCVAQADPFAVMFSWMGAFATLGIVGLQLLVSLAVIAFFRTTRKDTRVWNTLVAPFLGGVGLLYVLALMLDNLPALSGTDSPVVRSFPWVLLSVLLTGIGGSLYIQRRWPELYQNFAYLLDQA